jgi:hypothetical protein
MHFTVLFRQHGYCWAFVDLVESIYGFLICFFVDLLSINARLSVVMLM